MEKSVWIAKIKEYLIEKKQVQTILLEFFEDSDKEDENFYNFLSILDELGTRKDQQEFENLLQLILHIVNNHHRSRNIYSKIERIFTNLKSEISDFTSSQILNIFKSNKLILFYFIESKIIKPDEHFYEIISSEQYKKEEYLTYFFHEIKVLNNFPFKMKKEIESKLEKFNLTNITDQEFNQLRKIGENNSEICQLIRNDSIDKFVSYITKLNVPLNLTIEPSPLETNSFLINKKPSLIEYAAFYGSFQIFNYLRFNNVALNQSLWLYSIHGHNNELFHLLEENSILPKDSSFFECLIESIKCHFIDLTNYIIINKLNENDEIESIFENESLKFCNYYFFPNNLQKDNVFFNLVQYNYCSIVQVILDFPEIDINVNSVIIQLDRFIKFQKKKLIEFS